MLTREQVLGCRATIRTEPSTSRRWRESIFVAALDSIDFLESRIASLEAERDKAVELLIEIVPSSKCDLCYPSYCWPHGEKVPCPIGEAQKFLALVGGEVKNG